MAEIVTLGGVTLIHLTYRCGGSDTDWRIACMPEVTNFCTAAHHPNYLRSDDTRAVTCQRCRSTPVFKSVREKERP